MDRAAALELIAQQQRTGFADVAGSETQATIRVTDRLLNQILTTELKRSPAVREARVHAMSNDRLAVTVALPKLSFLPPITVDVLIERQPSLPESPVVVLKLTGIGGLTRFAGPAVAFLNLLPRGIRMVGDRVHVDIAALLQQRGWGFVLAYVDELRVNTEEGALRVAFHARLRPSAASG